VSKSLLKTPMLHVCCMCVACVLHVCCMCVACVLHVCCMCVACVLHVCCLFRGRVLEELWEFVSALHSRIQLSFYGTPRLKYALCAIVNKILRIFCFVASLVKNSFQSISVLTLLVASTALLAQLVRAYG
jgi:hypothetical protein